MSAGIISYLAMQLVLVLQPSLSSISRWQACRAASATANDALHIAWVAVANLEVWLIAFPAVLLAELILVNDAVDATLAVLAHWDELLVGVAVTGLRVRAGVRVVLLVASRLRGQTQHVRWSLTVDGGLVATLTISHLPRHAFAVSRVVVSFLVAHVARLDGTRQFLLGLLAAPVTVH